METPSKPSAKVDSLIRKIAERLVDEITVLREQDTFAVGLTIYGMEQIIASELAEREKQVEELIAAFQEVMESERLKTGLTPAQFKQVWARQLAALSGLGMKK